METWQKSIDFHKERFSFFGQLAGVFTFFFLFSIVKHFLFHQDTSILIFILGIFSFGFIILAIDSYKNFSFLQEQDGSEFPELKNNLIYSRKNNFF